jgi:metal-responsive CopG/Arc/MetJ family transcriptional regulator
VREPTADPQIQVRMSHELKRAIEEFRRQEPDIPSRPEAIRRLLKQAVMARQEETSFKNLVGVTDAS